MPTGHTAPIVDGEEVTLQDFAVDCARSMTMAYHMHESGGPLRYPPYRPVDEAREDLDEALKESERWRDTTEEEKYAEWSRVYETILKDNRQREEKAKPVRERLLALREQVVDWDAPAINQSLKDFMLQQLDVTLEYEGSALIIKPLEYVKWCEHKDFYTQQALNRARRRVDEQQEWYRQRIDWIESLADSLNIKMEI